MKIGILTFHRCINYGSYWQARCLAEGLRSRGHDAFLLDHASRRVDIAEWRCALRPTLPAPAPDRARYRTKIRRFFRAFESLPLSPRFPLERPARMPRCDAVVVGSDEVWNLSHPWYGGYPLFYGEGLRTPRLLAHAASFGSLDPRAGLAPHWAQKLRAFEAISVRDQTSQAVVAEAIGREPELVLDPCLQFPPEPGAADGELPGRPYAVVYGHGFSDGFAANAKRWARRRGLLLLSVGYRNDWANRQWLEAGPHEFAHAIAHAQAVATNFFHGCVFALRHRKPFACESSWYRGNKLRCLMDTVGAQRHLLGEDAPASAYAAALGEPLDDAVPARIETLRHASDRHLDRALAARRMSA